MTLSFGLFSAENMASLWRVFFGSSFEIFILKADTRWLLATFHFGLVSCPGKV